MVLKSEVSRSAPELVLQTTLQEVENQSWITKRASDEQDNPGYFKTWTVDSGLDHGLDCGLWTVVLTTFTRFLSPFWMSESG